MIPPQQVEIVDDFTQFGVHAFTTTRQVGSFGTKSSEQVRDVMGRWDALRATMSAIGVRRLATAAQVHGTSVRLHVPGWEGWLRGPEADGHAATARGTAVAVTVADCVPVFIAHPSGAVALLHSGWRGTAARIVDQGIATLTHRGFPARELRMHLGPAWRHRRPWTFARSSRIAPARSAFRTSLRRRVARDAITTAFSRIEPETRVAR